MNDELPIVTPDFFSSELDKTRQFSRKISKMGGPYAKSDRIKRRNEVFRLHFSMGYSTVKIAQLLQVNRHTIESDIKYGYSILSKEWEKGKIESWFMKQIYRLEEQRTRLLEKLNEFTGKEYLSIENLLKEIDVKIFHMEKDVMLSTDAIHDKSVKKINEYYKTNFPEERVMSLYDFFRVSTKTFDKINEMIEKDHQDNDESWL